MSKFAAAILTAAAMLFGAEAASAAVRPAAMTQTDTTTHTVPYTTNGRTRTWAYTWNASGQPLTVDGPMAGTGDTVTYTYNTDGYLASVTNEVGHATTITAWNGRGQPTSVTDPNGVVTTLSYDFAGRVLTTTINPGGAQSQYAFEYDAGGNLSKITQPGGGYLQYTYDAANRLTLITNDRGQTQTFAVNDLGDPTAVTVRTSGSTITRQQSFVYDELGRLIQSIGAGSQTTGFAYDKVDNPTTLTDARGKVFGTTFDALDRVIAESKPGGEVVEYAHDPADQLTLHEDGRNLQTTRTVDGFGQVIREVSPDRGTLSYWYDAAGNVTKIVDGDGEESNYTYDNAGRVLTITFPGTAAETVTYTYDSTAGGNKGVGRLTSVTEESGSTAFTYDAQGRVTTEAKDIQGRAYSVQYAYDANGQITEITLPSGRTVAYARAADGLVTGIATKATPAASPQALASDVAYRPFGPLEGLTFGNGLALTNTYDGNDWLTRTEVKAIGVTRLDLTYGRNANGQLAGVTDNAASGRGATFGYYDSGRLQYGVGPWGDESYDYDLAGNRTDKRRDVGGVVTYELAVPDATSNRILEVRDGSWNLIRDLGYRAGGDLATSDATTGPDYIYYYNARKRLVVSRQNGVDVGWYGYDFKGRRVWRAVLATGTVQTHYVFDQDGRLLAEHDGATGAVVREYVWLDDMAVAMVDSSTGTAQTYFIHTGQIDEPLVMTDAAKAKVWDAYVEPYGTAQVFGTPSAGLDLRLPGQWLQAETGGLHQNWHRDYDPSLGRYIEVDPLGIEAGQNVFAYVDGRPTTLIDVNGLNPVAGAAGGFVVGGPIGAVVGGVGGLVVAVGGGYTIGQVIDWYISQSRGKSDPVTLPVVNPGRDCKGKCNPCPPGARWWVNKPGHGHKNGYWHVIRYNQDPKTCKCYPDRPSQGLTGK